MSNHNLLINLYSKIKFFFKNVIKSRREYFKAKIIKGHKYFQKIRGFLQSVYISVSERETQLIDNCKFFLLKCKKGNKFIKHFVFNCFCFF